jgi:ribonuclease P protein component
MLKKQNRLTSKFQFNVARKYGTRVDTDLASIYALKPKNYNGDTRVGVVVSSKFHKKAVKRNRARRLVREFFQANLANLPTNLWISVYPKQQIIGKTYEEVTADFTKILQKISIAG